MLFGACYYPEHWSMERWEVDAALMQKARFNVVRMGEFAWTKMEPVEGEFQFSWLLQVVNLLGAKGIKTILGTPTAAPPKWLIDRHPHICPTDYEGRTMGFGHRRYYCFNNQTFHGYTKRIVEKMAEVFVNHEHVIGWQIDNEFGCGGTTRCYCEDCRKAFIDWLKERYITIEAINENWGTVFSNQTYSTWEEINLPGFCALNAHNPGLELDYKRFASDSVIRYQKIQLNALKQMGITKPITSNMMGGLGEIDYFKMGEEHDISSFGLYPNGSRSKEISAMNPAIQHDAVRGVKQKNYWVLEHQSGTPGGGVMFRTPKPGDMRRWTYQSIGHGADAIVYFRFRTCLFGVEEYWHGILNHDGEPNARYAEVTKIGEELQLLSGLIENSESTAQVAMIRSFDVNWVFEIQPHIENYSYPKHFVQYYRYFYEHNIPVDILSPEADFSAYKMVIVPNLILCTAKLKQQLFDYVRNGGVLVLDFRAGAKAWNNQMEPQKLPGDFKALLGIEIRDYGVLMKEESVALELELKFKQYISNQSISSRQKATGQSQIQQGSAYYGTTWYDVIDLKGAEGLVTYTTDYYSGKAAVTVNTYGKGKACYFGTEVSYELLSTLMKPICDELEVRSLLQITQAGIEVCCRLKGNKHYYFILNHKPETCKIDLKHEAYLDILTGMKLQGKVELAHNEVLVLESVGGAV